ncbi:hypothetical protein [Mycolicibacterium gilvum]|uniref:Uncharacterized protein n=1 Tax=Mycolicibacterium gilvum TaxID=1804 RepID=A0A378SLF3_9MYCO|nr:hypothetical protein [Mycolicibacterium gilvum]MCV7054343.1 hypothetical protein [Mycolicibacterium gilvum]STZ42704.1 Uncharacterised protein [Mycolicibacterium gilvum]
MSPVAEVLGVSALVFGIVALLFALIYIWDRWVKGTVLERSIDAFFDRLGKLFDR